MSLMEEKRKLLISRGRFRLDQLGGHNYGHPEGGGKTVPN